MATDATTADVIDGGGIGNQPRIRPGTINTPGPSQALTKLLPDTRRWALGLNPQAFLEGGFILHKQN